MLHNPSYPSNFALQLFITVIYVINSGIIINNCKIGKIYLFIVQNQIVNSSSVHALEKKNAYQL